MLANAKIEISLTISAYNMQRDQKLRVFYLVVDRSIAKSLYHRFKIARSIGHLNDAKDMERILSSYKDKVPIFIDTYIDVEGSSFILEQ